MQPICLIPKKKHRSVNCDFNDQTTDFEATLMCEARTDRTEMGLVVD